MIFISYGKRGPKRIVKRVIPGSTKRSLTDSALDRIAKRILEKPSVKKKIEQTARVGQKLMDVNITNIKKMTPRQKADYKQWAGYRVSWFQEMKKEARTQGATSKMMGKLDTEISRLKKILIELQ